MSLPRHKLLKTFPHRAYEQIASENERIQRRDVRGVDFNEALQACLPLLTLVSVRLQDACSGSQFSPIRNPIFQHLSPSIDIDPLTLT